MFRMLLSLLFPIALLSQMFTTDPPGGDPPEGDPPAGDPPKPDPEPEVTLTPEQRKWVDGQIAAARRKAENEGKSKAEQAAAAAKAQADEEAKIKKQEEEGEYEAAKATLISERDEARAEAKAHEDRIAAMLAMLSPGVEKRWTDLPEDVTALYDGADDDILAKAAHLEKTAGLVAKLTAAPTARVGLTPRPNGTTVPDKITSPVSAKQITG